MDIIAAITTRKSIRAFKPDPVPAEVLRDIVRVAQQAPSWANTQPWEFAIVGGKKLEEIKLAFAGRSGERPAPDFAGPGRLPEPYAARAGGMFAGIAKVTGMAGGDRTAALWWLQQGENLYGAPAAIYIYLERDFCFREDATNVWPVFDCGLVAQNIMLLANCYGLGTIAQAQAVHHPDILRDLLGIAETKAMLLGIAIGYPDWDEAVNSFKPDREGVDAVARCYDID